jgi:hypothetical protein
LENELPNTPPVDRRWSLSKSLDMTTLTEIPIFTLGTVLFPQGQLPLRVFEPRYIEMTKICIRDDAPFGVCLIREGKEVGAPAVPYETGCSARITRWDMPQTGMFQLMARGESIFRIVETWTEKNGLVHAKVEFEEVAPLPLPAGYGHLANLLERVINRVGEDNFSSPVCLDDAGWVGWRLVEMLPLDAEVRQRLLEMRDPLAVLNEVQSYLQSRPPIQ